MMKRNVLNIVPVFVIGVAFSLHARTGAVSSRSASTLSKYYPVDRSAECLPERILIQMNNEGLSKSSQSLQATLQKIGGLESRPLFKTHQSERTVLFNILEISLAAGTDPIEAADLASRQPDVLWAEPVYVRRPAYVPNDFYYDQQWYLPQIQIEPAWDVFRAAHPDGGEEILIGIVDTGVSLYHPDLRDRIWENPGETALNGLDDDGNGYTDDVNGWDFGDDDNDPNPSTTNSDGRHGTGVSGVAAAITGNNGGVASPLLDHVRILPVKTSEDADVEQLIVSGYEGIVYAVDQGADVVNLSFGGAGASNTEQTIIQYALDHDVLVVASAGNDNDTQTFYPAGYPGVVSVAATDENDLKASFSNWGVWIKLSAPGTNMITSWQGDDYQFVAGTSFSAPLVAGAAGLVMQDHPDWTARQVAEQVRITADPIDALNPSYAHLMGTGRLNVYRALTVSSPSVRISDVQIAETEGGGNDNGIAEPGETLALTFTATNYLSPFPGGEARFTVKDANPHVSFQRDVVALPVLGTGSVWQNAENPVLVHINESATRGEIVYFWIDISGGDGYEDRDWIKLQIAPPYVTVAATNAKLSVSSTGRLGFIDYPENFVGDGFVFGEAGNLLFEGAFMAGNGSNALSDVARGTDQNFQNDNFSPVTGGEVMLSKPGQHGDEEARAVFSDAQSQNPLNIEVTQNTLSFEDAGTENFILISYDIRNLNPDPNPITNFYAGLFMDWDVGDPSTNRVGFDRALNLGYMYDPSLTVYGGLAVVSAGGVRSYATINNSDEIYDGYSKAEKWAHLSGGIQDVTPRTGSDYSHVLAVGPLTLYSDSTVRIGFAVLGGSGLADLKQNAEAAQSRWQALFPNEPNPYPVYDFVLKANFPNPFNNDTVIRYSLSAWTHVRLFVYDLTGREVARLVDEEQDAGPHEAVWDGKSSTGAASSGVYVYQLTAGDRARSGKMVFIR